jgi:VWFA-related protein
MSTPRLIRSLVFAAGVCVLVGGGPAGRVVGQQAGQQTPQPDVTFRADANFVLTDVFVTADGKPVTDLTQADFEVREDGVVQAIRSFEAVRHTTQPVGLPRRNPSTVAESNAMIGDPRRRVFVVFLDTFHVDRGSAMYVRKALQDFLRTALGPDDLVAYMTPHMSGRDISFSSSTEPLIRYFEDNPVWGVADEIAGTESDSIERDLASCFGDTQEQREAWLGLRSRLREQKSIEAMRGLVLHLDGQRESRKAVIAVTLGWRLFTANETRVTDEGTKGRVFGVQPLGVGPDGRLGTPDRGRIGGIDRPVCDVVRMQASMADSRHMFQELIGEANRSSTSFYTVDAAGLRTETRPMPISPIENQVEARNRERMPFTTRLDSIRTLGEATNGLVLADTNDFKTGLQRIADDFNAYYLLGYTSTNDKSDGRYRKIKVTVKRPGVQVRAREGYLARRMDERPSSDTPATTGPTTSSPEQAQFTAALGRLAPPRPGMPLVVSAAAGTVPGGTARAIRVTAELDPTIAATTEWVGGGEAQAFVRDAKGATITSGTAPLAKGARTVEIEVPIVEGMAGDVKVQVRLTGAGPLARYTDTTSVTLDAMPAGWGAARLSRRGPSTGVAWVPTADPRFRRQERLRVSVGVGAEAGTVTGTLLDRQGRAMNVPVKIEQADPAGLVAELALAPLAAGDYVLALSGGDKRLLVPLRVVP